MNQMQLLRTELTTAEIPEIYRRFAHIVGDQHWKRRVSVVKAEAKGSHSLADYLHAENSIAFALDRCRDLVVRYGNLPRAQAENRKLWPGIGFAAQVLSMMDIAPRQEAERLRRRVHGALNNPDDMRGLQLELMAATHFARRGHNIAWPEMNGIGTFDLLVESIGSSGLEVECKSISDDKGRKVHRREALAFYDLLLPHLTPLRKSLTAGLSVVLTVPGRLPTQYKDRAALAKHVSRQILIGRSATLDNGIDVRLAEFDVNSVGHLANDRHPAVVRTAIDNVTATRNREGMAIGTSAGGALIFALQSAASDSLMDAVFDTLSTAARNQVTCTRPAMLLAGFCGLNGEQLLRIAEQDNDPVQRPTGLSLGASKFLFSPDRDHVVGVGFLSSSALLPEQNGLIDSGGTVFFFPKRASKQWHDDFNGLFSQGAHEQPPGGN